jgi:sugar lactone lactonase YvrE
VGYNLNKVSEGLTFPESPRWHGGRQAFYFVDIDEGELYELRNGLTRKLFEFGTPISGMTFDDGDGFFVAKVLDRRIVHLEGALDGEGAATEVADLTDHVGFGLNDMTRGADGQFYVGGLNFNAIAKFEDDSVEVVPGSFLQVSADGSVRNQLRTVAFPNAVVIPPGGTRVLMADTYQHRIHSWPIRADGTLGEQGVWADLGEELPDGMCLDAEGALWIASHNRAIRVLEGGEVTDEIVLPDGHVTACALGGPDGHTLVITAAASIDRRIVRASRTGVVYAGRVDVPGAGLPSVYA